MSEKRSSSTVLNSSRNDIARNIVLIFSLTEIFKFREGCKQIKFSCYPFGNIGFHDNFHFMMKPFPRIRLPFSNTVTIVQTIHF